MNNQITNAKIKKFPPARWLEKAWQNLPLGFKGVIVIALPLAILLASLTSLFMRELESTKLENQLKRALQNQRGPRRSSALECASCRDRHAQSEHHWFHFRTRRHGWLQGRLCEWCHG